MIYVVGVGPGAPEYLTFKARDLVESADIVAGFGPPLKTVGEFIRGEKVEVDYAGERKKLRYIAAQSRDNKCVFCCAGDPDFSDSQLLKKIADLTEIEIVPGVSSTQIAASRAKVAWEDSAFISLHKRGPIERRKMEMVRRIKEGKDVILLPRPWDFMPAEIAAFLIKNDVKPDTRVSIYENLTLDEKEQHTLLKDVRGSFSDLCIMLIRRAAE
jgi:cobalt-precorrin-7 (C5)-methyltransferase